MCVYLRLIFGEMRFSFVRLTGALLQVPVALCLCFPLYSQTNPLQKPAADTSYIRDFTRDLTARFYLSRKYTRFGTRDYLQKEELRYRPNDRLNFGIGFNYYFIGLNLGVNIPFMNDDDLYGKTRFLDAQSHIYLSRLVADLYLQHYKGYYLANPRDWTANWTRGDPFPQRGDLRTISTGLNMHYIFNHRRFSYRAAFLQNEWQKKSAGTFLLGGEGYLVDARADSSITAPAANTAFLNGLQYRRSVHYSVGGNMGYAHTFVYKSNYFVTLSLVAGVGAGATRLLPESGEDITKAALRLSSTARFGLGYNSQRYYAGISVVNLSMSSQMPVRRSTTSFTTGNIRINFCRRFSLEPPRLIRKLDKKLRTGKMWYLEGKSEAG